MYPRLYCLGLIEAIQFPNELAVSDAPYPRLYCLGLIEALGTTYAVRLGRWVSEALLPRPH